jgi:hypothetical protein
MTTFAYALLDSTDATGAIAGVLLALFVAVGSAVAGALYLTPLIVAAMRKSHLLGPVAAVNILLGWSLIGWVAALVLALIPKPQRSTVIVHTFPSQLVQSHSDAGTLSSDGLWIWDGQQWLPRSFAQNEQLVPQPHQAG